MAFVTGTPCSRLSARPMRGVAVSSQNSFTGVQVARCRRASCASPSAVRMMFDKTIAEALDIIKSFPTLMTLIKSCEMTFDGQGTLFAPTEDAFSRLPSATIDYLLSTPEAARAVLARHWLPGQVLTSKQIKGVGYFESIPGGPLGYEGLGAIVRIGGAQILMESSDRECGQGTIHALDSVLIPPGLEMPKLNQTYTPSVKNFGDSTIVSVFNPKTPPRYEDRARDACLPGTVGGRKAMGLVKQLPFYMYGPPFNAAKQEDYEPISIAYPDVAKIDYQVFEPGTVIVTPDEVSAADLLPVSGMSKYIGQTKRLVEGDGESNYSRLD